MVESLLRDGTTTVPALTAALPISRQAVAKHLSTLDHAGLVERSPAAGREIEVEVIDAPHRLVWWWSSDDEPSTRVEFLIVAAPRGTRVVVTESVPSFPIAMLAASFALVAA